MSGAHSKERIKKVREELAAIYKAEGRCWEFFSSVCPPSRPNIMGEGAKEKPVAGDRAQQRTQYDGISNSPANYPRKMKHRKQTNE